MISFSLRSQRIWRLAAIFCASISLSIFGGTLTASLDRDTIAMETATLGCRDRTQTPRPEFRA